MHRAAIRHSFWLLVLLSFLGVGCGHEATESDCQLIADRIVELELRAQNVTDAAEIQRRRNDTLGLGSETNRKALLEGCVGRRVSDGALACVRSATTATEITDQCLQ